MRLLVRLLAVAGMLALAAGAAWAYAARNGDPVGGPVVLLVLGTVAALAATGFHVFAGSRRAGLVLEPGDRLPVPSWWAPLGAAGLVDLLAGAFVSVPLAVAGAVLVLAAAIGLGLDLRPDPRPDMGAGTDATDEGPARVDRSAVRAARAIRDFGARHAVSGDASVDVVVEHLGRGPARIVLVGRDGAIGDLVLRTVARAEQAVRLAGATRHDTFPPELVGRARTGRYEWKRMAGMQLGGPRRA